MKENIRDSMLAHLFFSHHTSHWHYWVWGGSNRKHYMLAFHWECIDSKLNKMQGMLYTFMLVPLFYTNIFGRCAKQKNNWLSDIIC